MARKPTDTVALTLRVREELRRKLEKAAERNAVSINNEITERLDASFKRADEDQKWERALVQIRDVRDLLDRVVTGVRTSAVEDEPTWKALEKILGKALRTADGPTGKEIRALQAHFFGADSQRKIED